MQVIGCQLDLVWEDKAATHLRAQALLKSAAIEPGSLVVLPEMFATGFSMNVAGIAEDASGPTHTFLANLARELRCTVVGGVVTRAVDGRGRNDAVTYDARGELINRYCKLHPFSYGGETRHYQAGEAITSFQCGEFQVAPFVCYDLRFPEIFRAATRQGAQLLVVVANWPRPRDAHWQALLRARAIENQAYVVGINRAGRDPKLEYAGHSLILDPRGETLAAAGEDEQLVRATLELAPLEEYRRQFPALSDMRAEFFGK